MKVVNILFLDIDGPICNERSYYAYEQDKHKCVFRSWDPLSVRLIDRLCIDYKLKVVISSTWRKIHDVPTILQTYGFRGEFHPCDKTPMKFSRAGRGTEIKEWLIDHKDNYPNEHIGKVLIIDDEDSGGDIYYETAQLDLKPYAVFSDTDDGFGYRDYKKSIQILKKKFDISL